MVKDDRTPEQLYACIMRGVATLVGIVTVLVCACIYIPALHSATSTDAFKYTTLGIFLIGIVCLFVNALAVHNRTFQRITHVLVAVSVTALMILAAHMVRNKTTVPIALALATLAVGIAAPLGRYHKGDLRKWLTPAMLGLLVLILVGVLNIAVFGSSVLESLLSVAAIILFTLLTAVDANVFTKNPEMCKFDCCEEGVLNIYLNFSNIVVDIMGLSGR